MNWPGTDVDDNPNPVDNYNAIWISNQGFGEKDLGNTMSGREALFQSLATAGAVLFTFVGVCHFVVGVKLFPWAPVLLGPIVWYGLGIVALAMGFLLVLGTLRVIRFPVFSMALISAAIGLAVGLFTAAAHHEFHLFAFTVALAATGTAVFYRKASRLAALTKG